MQKYVCDLCGYVYDPMIGDPDSGIAPGTASFDLYFIQIYNFYRRKRMKRVLLVLFALTAAGAFAQEQNRMPLIGDPAPAFTAVTTQGEINFPKDFKGKWIILFSHPADFTPVCTTEFMTFASMMDEFKALNTQLIGLSIDSIYAHIAWLRKIQELKWNDLDRQRKPSARFSSSIRKESSVRFCIIRSQRAAISMKLNGLCKPCKKLTPTT